jgi:single-strand DNA-binding protein
MADLNRVALTGNLTADPQLRGENQNVLSVRLAVTGRRKDGDEWVNTSHFFDVTVFGNRAKALGGILQKGSRIAVDGRLEWREWEQDDVKRQAVQVIAEDVVLLGDPKGRAVAADAPEQEPASSPRKR